MKILIAYDGSQCAGVALDDLSRAGLADDVECVVLSVADPVDVAGQGGAPAAMEQTLKMAQSAARRLGDAFSKWRITAEAAAGAAQGTILRKIQTWGPDLVVLGSHGRKGLKRLILGSVSQYILTHAHCSVRIGREHSHQHAPRLLIGTDGSTYAMAAIQSVIARRWPAGTQVRVVSVADARAFLMMSADAADAMYSPVVEEQLRIVASAAIDQANSALAATGLSVVSEVCYGMPGNVLVAEAQQWDADCVFVGAKGLNMVERVLMGSVSTAVAARAPCSVEVVRPARTQ